MPAPREYYADAATTAVVSYRHWCRGGQKTLAADAAEDVVRAGLNMLLVLQSEGVEPIDPVRLRRHLLDVAELLGGSHAAAAE